jgi:hypothetical protein
MMVSEEDSAESPKLILDAFKKEDKIKIVFAFNTAEMLWTQQGLEFVF